MPPSHQCLGGLAVLNLKAARGGSEEWAQLWGSAGQDPTCKGGILGSKLSRSVLCMKGGEWGWKGCKVEEGMFEQKEAAFGRWISL